MTNYMIVILSKTAKIYSESTSKKIDVLVAGVEQKNFIQGKYWIKFIT